MTGLKLQFIQLPLALMGRFGPILSGFVFFPKLFTCLQNEGDSRQCGSVEVTDVTLRDGLNFPTAIRLLDSSALGLPMDYGTLPATPCRYN